MWRSSLLVLLLFALPACAEEPSEAALDAGLVNPGYHPQPEWFKTSFLDLREDVAEAAADDQRVMLYFFQDGCPYCKKLLETNFALRDLVEKTQRHFDVISLNMWGDREVTDMAGNVTTEKQFAAGLKVMFTPTILFLDEQGEVVVRMNGYYPPHKFNLVLDYVAGRKEREMPIQAWYAQVAPSPAQGKLHIEPEFLQAPYRLQRSGAKKPLLVMFEQKECEPCDELHLDILRRPESRTLLQQLDVALLDMWGDTPVVRPDGETTSAAQWARDLNVKYAPSLLFFDSDGREVFRADAYLKAFHIQSVMDYVISGAYREQPSFQRYISVRADALEAQGVHIDLMD